MWRMWAFAGLVLGLGQATESALAQDASVLAGKNIAEMNCSRCHAVGPAGDSPYAPAPPFRTLHNRYPVDDLAEALAEGIVVGHPEMPRFELTPQQVDSFILYLKSLEPAK